jgi:hypothetical protein
MTVQELIDRLQEVRDKSVDVLIDVIQEDESLITYGSDIDVLDESDQGPITLQMREVVNRY